MRRRHVQVQQPGERQVDIGHLVQAGIGYLPVAFVGPGAVLSHRTAPVELRESVDFARKGLDAALAGLASRGIGRELVVLSTCNRAEIYAVAETNSDSHAP